ncbi:PilZ domain-containing protein [Oricola sp.]|uniref:PilZ domain-containing protein n=1 Tax=Oricola sp. TaxID=1979950 RepID=UPI0025FF3612|nr:PilZ domain-containing protein [Oricola sp.]MCI5073578.1 PilZ domain-containing protein [Oricola sp.]
MGKTNRRETRSMESFRLPVERRAAQRNRCAHLAEIRLGSSVVLQAIVKDLSPHGAKLQVLRDSWLPRSFELAIPALDLRQPATCRWRRGDFAGLEFDTMER